MNQDELSSLYELFETYMGKCVDALREAGLEDHHGEKLRQLDYAGFCRFWERIELSPFLKQEWINRLSPRGFEVETAMITEVLSTISVMPSTEPHSASIHLRLKAA